MKIVEALKNLQTIEKRIAKNCTDISNYCAYVTGEPLAFETEEAQRNEVSSIVQANIDLEKEYLRLKYAIETTNLSVKVKIDNFQYSISELIQLKRKASSFRVNTYKALNLNAAQTRFNQIAQKGVDSTNTPRIIPLFKEKDKNTKLEEWQNFISQIDGKLEVINAETDLIGY